ncbi:hypothetical protein [Roseibium litorale]|uniref:Uncharacterized protein n=1 Tax=Roseibium litorale TaxID=2803841 RepID=A0ABR9CR62_9HYPH|nr:hypothetical protein [Roseibium litorale]MBD8893317.1 hypothetical protein [Roseibium litorale]
MAAVRHGQCFWANVTDGRPVAMDTSGTLKSADFRGFDAGVERADHGFRP